MSLIASASPWINDDPTTTNRKRMATMKKPTVSLPPMPNAGRLPGSGLSHDQEEEVKAYYTDLPGSNLVAKDDLGDRDQDQDQNRTQSRVTELVNKITAFNADDAGQALADFKPLSPVENAKRGTGDSPGKQSNPGGDLDMKPLLPRMMAPTPAVFAPNPQPTAYLSNYRQSYEPSSALANARNTVVSGVSGDPKLMDRLAYITYLLEEMKQEKTNNVTEEFILYSLLGIFVIYIVDAFARTGKYTR